MISFLRPAIVSGAMVFSLALPIVAYAETSPQTSITPATHMEHRSEYGHHSGHGHHDGMRGHRKMMMHEFKRLHLSDTQWKKIHDLDASFRASHNGDSSQRPDRREMKRHEDAIMTILTPAQREQLKSDMKAAHAAHAGMHHE